MDSTVKSVAAIPRRVVAQLRNARLNVITIGVLATAGGVVMLLVCVLFLLPGLTAEAEINSAVIALPVGAVVGLVIGLGLWSLSDTARGIGALWFLLWGLINGVLALWPIGRALTTGESPDLALVFVAGAPALVQILFGAVLLGRPATFVCRYLKRKPLEPMPLLESLEAAQQDKQAGMREYAASLLEQVKLQD